jgi:hypothetical protein
MKRTLLLACLTTLIFSCEDDGPDDCYAVDITREECLARGKCTYLHSFFVFTNDDGCLMGEAWSWFPGRNLGLGVCSAEILHEHYNNSNDNIRLCRQVAPNLYQVIERGMRDLVLSPDWKGCYSNYEWMGYSSPFTGDCRPRCGDGIVDPGEACEASIAPSFENCTDLGSWLERDYQAGELTCAACTQNLFECVPQ